MMFSNVNLFLYLVIYVFYPACDKFMMLLLLMTWRVGMGLVGMTIEYIIPQPSILGLEREREREREGDIDPKQPSNRRFQSTYI